MTILALEFSSEHRSVAVARNGSVLSEATETGGRGVAAFAMIERALAGAKFEREQIQTIAVGLGPGSYAGIRSAIALAQGWKLARNVSLSGVSSVAAIVSVALAEGIFGPVSVVVNAQREEFYCATCDIVQTGCTEVAPLKILARSEVLSLSQGRLIIGPEAQRFPGGRLLFPGAAAVAKLAAVRNDSSANDKLEPIYLRETSFTKLKR
ncbi:MAG TPA: tRNA (adenosine(37)-N6)-threonylcarbamoyltransferase complex dimerization subunit type 1 TsaB [Verrucomicrobiae bacterium]|nr:tRNA (adenosine(37)-N6)-threonylcarbamoyltransferase complex dimerization subunit type 1 TsaB [Verrucomicrobiae bacterium]